MPIPMESLVATSASGAEVPSPSPVVGLDLPGLASAFGHRLHEADLPVTPDQAIQYVRALQLTTPASREGLYVTTRAIFVTDMDQLGTFDSIFAQVFGVRGETTDDGVEAGLEPALPMTH
jgi:uncharacterized protein with von Willebrand factor type A (vWA) domain